VPFAAVIAACAVGAFVMHAWQMVASRARP
jgi:hypothetical protein